MAQSAFIVRVPEAEPYVHHFRERFDPPAKLGVPAHLTVLFPFMSPDLIDDAVLDTVRVVLSSVKSFPFRLPAVHRFPNVTCLVPEPAEAFVELTWRLVERFSSYPPYGGEHATVIPHLTVARATSAELDGIEWELTENLKSNGVIQSICAEVDLIENASGRWLPLHTFSLDRT